MELKVWVEGIQRIVCGVTEVTTCQDVVFALAHATGKTGRFTLIERWRNNERLLAPHENPLKILMKWGEYSSDVQFILQRSDQQQQQKKDAQQQQQQQQHQTPPLTQTPPQSQQQLIRQQQKLNQLNNNHIGANGKHTSPTSPTSPGSHQGSGNNNASPIIPNGVLSPHNHINSNNNISSQHYAHHPSNGDEQQQHHHPQQHQHAKSKLHQNNLKNSTNNQLHQHVQHHQQQHHHQHQLSSSSTSSDHQHRSHQHQQSNGVGALIRTGNDPSNGSVGAGPGVPAAKQSELIISSSNGTAGALERGKETRKSLNSSGSSGKTEQHHHHAQQLHHQQSQKHQAQTNQQNQNVGIVRGIVQHQQKFTHVQRHSPSSTTVALAKGGVSTTVSSSDHSSSSNSSTSSSVSSTASSSSNASSNNTSTSSGIGGSGGSAASGTSGHHHQSHSTQQPQGATTPVEATYASVIKKPKAHATTPASNGTGTATGSGNNVVGEFNAADLRSSLDRKVNGLVFSNGLNERVTQPPSTSPSGGMAAGPQQPPSATGSSVIVGATLKPEHQLLHHHQHGTMGRHYHHTQLQNLLCADSQQQLDTSSVSSVSSSSVGGGNNSSNHPSLLNGSTTNSPITGISSNGALVPPPYRDPPPPRNSPLSHTLTSLSSTGSGTGSSSQGRRQEKEGNLTGGGGSSSASSTVSSLVVVGPSGPEEILVGSSASDSVPHVTGYRELMQLIKLQREKINTQQADLSKYDTEIVYLENRSREQTDQLDAIAQEISKTEQQYRQTGDQLQTYQYVEEESELVRQQEKTLKSEITLLRSKLANCETELLQCKNKIRLLMDEILVEQRKYSRQYDPNRQQLLERALMCEVDRLQVEIDLAVQSADQANKAHEKLKGEVTLLEGAITDKKKQVEKLVHEMKEVNLQSLAVVPPADEVRHLLEVGSVKPGSTRRMIGSPRQLENAVPTSKNPHGVWV